jgi:hypothetical protein
MKPHSRASAVSVFRLNLITLLLLPLFPAALFAQQTPYYPGPQQPYPTGGQYDPGEQYQQPYSQAQADQTQSDYDQPQPGYEQPQTLGPDQLDQMVAPIALNPDPLVALMLAASTYPAQVADADQWRQSQGNAPPDQIAYGANQQAWDPSVKALTAFPQVLAEMDQNIQWTVSLGTAYYNQPQDVLQAIQFMRQRAQAAGNLQNTPEQAVNYDQGNIELMPANSQVVYVPAYNPWTAYGQPVSPYPGFSLLNSIGSFFNSSLGSSALQFGVGTVMSAFSSTPWGLLSWGLDWLTQNLLFNHSDYYSNSNAVADWGFRYGGRRAWMRPHREFASYNRGYGRNYNRGWEGSRTWNRGSYNRGYQSYRYNRAQRGYGMRTNYGSSYRSAYGSNYNRRQFGYGARAGYNSNLRFHDGSAHSSASGERSRPGYAYSNRSGYGSYRPPSSSFHQRSNGFMRGSGRPRSGGFYGGGHNSFGHQEGFKGPKFKAPKMRGGGHSFGGGHHSFGGGHHSFGGDHHSSGGGHSHGGHHR